jgi:hypothetical protein
MLETELGIAQFAIAYSRPTTIGSVIAKSDLHQAEGGSFGQSMTLPL